MPNSCEFRRASSALRPSIGDGGIRILLDNLCARFDKCTTDGDQSGKRQHRSITLHLNNLRKCPEDDLIL